MSAEAAILLLEVCGLLALLDAAVYLGLKAWDTGKIGRMFGKAKETGECKE